MVSFKMPFLKERRFAGIWLSASEVHQGSKSMVKLT
jgi:hypothetical protein